MIEVADKPDNRGTLLRFISWRREAMLIILLAVAVRLINFTAPYTDSHWIKQLQIAPIAKNWYLKGNYNILWPETDYSADRPAYIEIEFQLVTWLTALLYNLFGIHEWVGRLVTISFSTGSLVLMLLLLRLHLGKEPATYGLIYFAFAPSNWFFSRVLMSEPLMLFFSIALLYSFSLWLQSGSRLHYAMAVLSGALAFLVKLPTIILVVPLLFLAYRKYRWRLFRRWALWLLAIAALLPAALYYWHAKVHIGAHYFTVGVGFGGGMWFSLRRFLDPSNYSLMMQRLLKDHLTALGVVLLPLGLLATGCVWKWPAAGTGADDRRVDWNVFHAWLGAVVLYFIVVWGGNIRQTYYQLPLLPPAAGLIGVGWFRLSRLGGVSRWLTPTLLAIFLVLCVWGVQPFFEQYTAIHQAAAQLDTLDPAKAPVIIFPPGYGCLYYFNRPGWVGREGMGKPPSQVAAVDVPGPLYINDRIKRGARWAVYFIVTGQERRPDLQKYLQQNFATVCETAAFEIFDLQKPLAAGAEGNSTKAGG